MKLKKYSIKKGIEKNINSRPESWNHDKPKKTNKIVTIKFNSQSIQCWKIKSGKKILKIKKLFESAWLTYKSSDLKPWNQIIIIKKNLKWK